MQTSWGTVATANWVAMVLAERANTRLMDLTRDGRGGRGERKGKGGDDKPFHRENGWLCTMVWLSDEGLGKSCRDLPSHTQILNIIHGKNDLSSYTSYFLPHLLFSVGLVPANLPPCFLLSFSEYNPFTPFVLFVQTTRKSWDSNRTADF